MSPVSIPSPDQQGDEGQQFRLLAQALTDYAIYMMDTDGFITTWNPAAARIKGYESSEIIGQHFSRFFTDVDRREGLPQRILELARRSGHYESEGWRVRKDGKRFWAVAVLEAIRDADGAIIGFGKVTRDITERHEAREALVESERRFRLLIGSVIDYAIFMVDPSGMITNWNSGAERIKGYTADEVIGSHFSRFYTKEDRARGLPAIALEEAKRVGKYEMEGWRVRKDGGRFWASVVIEPVRDETGELIGFAKITRDITERRSAQEALRESERQFRLLVSSVTDYAIYMLDPNGVVVSWNAGAEKIKGYLADEIIGNHFSKFYTDEDRAAGKPARALYTALHEGRFEGEGCRVRKDGTQFWANVVIDPVRDECGQLVGFAKITRDITERREAQLALQRAQEQLAQSQKMEALGQLTGGIAHDFNNLLTIVGGQARLVKKSSGEPACLAAAEAIEVTVQRGAALTRQLLGFSRRQPLEARPISLAERMPGLKTMLSTSLPANVQLILSILPQTWPVLADPSEFDLAIMNLVLNARDALESGGAITITSENVSAPHSHLEPSTLGDFVCLNVVDNGAGIAPDILAKVFDPFFTTKEAGKGTGLGLSQVYGFAHQSGGTVRIESQLGKGTSVALCLPRSDAPQRKHVISPAPEGERLHARILLVEDNADVTEVTSALIKQLGYTLRIAPDAARALRMLEEESFDLIFSDIMMPGDIDGLQLAKEIGHLRPQLPILLASGSNKQVEEAQQYFMTLQKPYEINELDSAIQSLLRARDRSVVGSNLVDLVKAKRRRRSLQS